MNFIILPSKNRPQFYFSESKECANYFIHNFFYSKKFIIQFFINLSKRMLPESFIYLILKSFAPREDYLPAGLSDKITEIYNFIQANNEIFFLTEQEATRIHFIIRISHWQRLHERFVVICLKAFDKRPFTIVKAGDIENKDLFVKEFNNVRRIHNKFSHNKNIAFIPEPIILNTSNRSVTYFERPVPGVPFNDYNKNIIIKNHRRNEYINILQKCNNFLLELHSQNEQLTSQEYFRYFLSPIDHCIKLGLPNKYEYMLLTLKEEAVKIQKTGMPLVWMHGDFWEGSILYDNGKIGVIDWEFFTLTGPPLWDLFSLIFHIGSEFNYFSDALTAKTVDSCILDLAKSVRLDTELIQILFQSFLLYNIQNRDSATDNFWKNFLLDYWDLSIAHKNKLERLL